MVELWLHRLLLFLLISESEESLDDYLCVHHQLDEALASRYILKIMEGLQYLHDSRIIHANLSVSLRSNECTCMVGFSPCKLLHVHTCSK